MDHVIAGAGAGAQAREAGSLEGWQQGGKWFSYGGHAIFSRMAGQGEPLVLLHGFPTASWDWSRIWPMLVQQHSVLALDMLGFGFSDKPTGYHYSIEDQADLVQGWLEGLGLGTVHLFAHDYGCSVVQELLGHESPNTTQIYTHVTEAKKRETMEEAFEALGRIEAERSKRAKQR